MPNAARLTDAVDGTTAGEHSGHVPPHSPEPFNGEISGACSGDVRVNGLAAATVGSITTERDGCCGSSQGGSTEKRRPAPATPWPPIAGAGPSPEAAPPCGSEGKPWPSEHWEERSFLR